jgi:hypothetical protein
MMSPARAERRMRVMGDWRAESGEWRVENHFLGRTERVKTTAKMRRLKIEN